MSLGLLVTCVLHGQFDLHMLRQYQCLCASPTKCNLVAILFDDWLYVPMFIVMSNMWPPEENREDHREENVHCYKTS